MSKRLLLSTIGALFTLQNFSLKADRKEAFQREGSRSGIKGNRSRIKQSKRKILRKIQYESRRRNRI